MKVKFFYATMADLPALLKIERQGFTPEEAGSEAAFRERIKKIPDTFIVAKADRRLVGFVVGPVAEKAYIDDRLYDHLSANQPTGGNQLVLSIAVDPHYRGHGIGSKLLDELARVDRLHQRKLISLDTLEKNIPFYEANGFEKRGVSPSSHANEIWYNMVKEL